MTGTIPSVMLNFLQLLRKTTMKGIFVSTFFPVLLIFGLSSSISISQQPPAKTGSLGAPGTVISSTPFNLNTKAKPLSNVKPAQNGKRYQSSQTKKLYLATSKISQTFTLNTVTFKDAGISSSLPTDSNPNGSTATEVFSISSKKQ